MARFGPLISVLLALVLFACGGSGAGTDDGCADCTPSPRNDVLAVDATRPPSPDERCEPQCGGRECGDDGCGGECGSCPAAAPECVEGLCTIPCEPSCGDRECGDDGCGGSCGDCPEIAPYCVKGFCQMECDAACDGKECGDDGCGGKCGVCTGGKKCVNGICKGDSGFLAPCVGDGECDSGFCVYTDGGWVCTIGCVEECPVGWVCTAVSAGGPDLTYICLPECEGDCSGKECGDNGCGGSCGLCPEGEGCFDNVCKPGPCVPQCEDAECGADGCGGVCGECPADEPVCKLGQCTQGSCVDDCAGKECGDDGCGGSCGACPPFYYECVAGQCVSTCEPDCVGKECGSDGCEGSCGNCPAGKHCEVGICVSDCLPQCAGKECGADGCGGQCGVCSPGEECVGDICVAPGNPADCELVLSCLIGCPNYSECIGDCLALASPAGQVAYDDMLSCSVQKCPQYDDGTPQAQYCVLTQCTQDWNTCIGGWGNLGCNAILQCAANCNTAECQWDCIFNGSQAGQQVFWAMQVCFDEQCGSCGQDGGCWQTCIPQKCSAQLAACQGN